MSLIQILAAASLALGAKMSITTAVPQHSQGMSLLSITSLVSGGRRQIDRIDVFTSSAHNRFHLACQFEPQGFEDRRPLWSLGRMDHPPLRRKYGSAHHPI